MICKTIKNLNLSVIALSGQCFRLLEKEKGAFDIMFGAKYVRAYYMGNDKFKFDCTEKFFNKYLVDYFDLELDYKKFYRICDKKDEFLKKCISMSDGLRILKQDKFETIISFIISQRKSIRAIQTSIERLCKLTNKKIENKYGTFYAFPTAKDILKLSKAQLSSCGLGYRLPYVLEFCENYGRGYYDLEAFDKLSDDALIEKLMSIKGVGIKVASCVALFAYHRFSVCPKDVWIKRVIEQKYGGKIPKNYEKYQGIIQQFWFNYAKNYKL